MSRSGYTDDYGDDDPLAMGRWRQAVKRAIEGKRGQALLSELVESLDAMPDKKLSAGNFATVEGEFCTLGVLGAKRGTKMDDLGDWEDGCDTSLVGDRFGIAPAMAAEIMYMNDEAVDSYEWVEVVICGPMPEFGWQRHARRVRVERDPSLVAVARWKRMRAWVAEHLTPPPP